MDSKFKVHDLIVKVYAPQTTNSERKQVEAELYDLDPIKLQAGVYYMNYIKKMLKSRIIENSELQYVSENLIRLLTLKNVQNSIKMQLQLALENVLNIDTARGSQGKQLVQQFFNEICFNAFTNLTIESTLDISGLFMIISALFKTCGNEQFILQMFQMIHQQMGKLINQILIATIKIVMEQNSLIQQQLINDPSQLPLIQYLNISENLQIVKTWALIHVEMLQKFKKLKFKAGIKFIAASDDYARQFNSILKFYVPPINLTQEILLETEGSLVTNSGDHNLDLIINETKLKTLQCLKIIWNYLIKKKPKNLYSAINPYVQCAQQMVHVLANTLTSLAVNPNLESILENGHINGMVIHGIDIIASFSNERDFQFFYTQNSFKLLIQVILPLLRLSEKEKDDIENNPKEFVNYSIDICQKQKSKTYKTQAAKLLESIIDHVDGMLTFTVNFCIEVIQNIMQGGGQTDYIQQIITKFRLKFESEEEFMEVCLLALTIISYALIKRQDLMRNLDQLVLQHLQTFMSDQQSPIIKNRFCLFLAFYLDQLMLTVPQTTQEINFEKILQFLIGQLGIKGQKIVSLQALDTLVTQTSERVLTLKIQQNFDWIIDTLANYNINLMLHAYFDFLSDFIKAHYSNFTQDNLITFMQSLVNRIQKELIQQEEKAGKKTLNLKSKNPIKQVSTKANIRINKCWNTIRFIAEHQYFILNFLQIIEDSLLPLFEYLLKPSLIDFDDDIIFCLSSLMKKSKHVSPALRKIFPYLPQFQSKYKGIFGHLLEAVNYYIIYGKEFFEQDQQNLGLLFEMAQQSIFKKEKSMMLSNNLEGVMLLHMMLQNLDGDLIKQAKCDILTTVMSRLNDKPMSKTFQRSLLEVFLSSMLQDIEITLTYLQQQGFIRTFFTSVFESWRQMRQPYERKVLALALINLLFNSNMPQDIQDQFGFMLGELVNILIHQQRLEQKALLRKKKSLESALVDNILSDEEEEEKLNSQDQELMDDGGSKPIFSVTKIRIPLTQQNTNNGQSDIEFKAEIGDQEEDYINESDFKQEEYDLQIMINVMVTRINDIDEFEQFNQSFKRAYSANSSFLSAAIETSLSQKQKDNLNALLKTRRVELQTVPSDENEMVDESSQGSAGIKVPRRIVTVKRRLQGNSTPSTQEQTSFFNSQLQ
ncbi:UNKNOWN [Stylonychia lemnae]|uniref:Uncharacterized protein n=1 Tax=Stylonychia lemnae TaxID=5949 RepID=A0A078AEQ9_STYLE|nr:UNKNOWN [Stylonychia lemnae]|eukprot:CDW80715.1 UNKNOWN [Stylonychia lemnae]